MLSRIKPLRCFRQYSSKLIVPTRLWSSSCRDETLPGVPAKTLGSAAQSMTQSTAGRASKSLLHRKSPWINRTPLDWISWRFCSLPARQRLSMPVICRSGWLLSSVSAIQRPTKPQAPVMRIFNRIRLDRGEFVVESNDYLNHPSFKMRRNDNSAIA